MGERWTVMVKPGTLAEIKKQVRELIEPYYVHGDVEDSRKVFELCPEWGFSHSEQVKAGEECDLCHGTGQRRMFCFHEEMALDREPDFDGVWANGLITPDGTVWARERSRIVDEATFNPNYAGPTLDASREWLNEIEAREYARAEPVIQEWKAKGYILLNISNRSPWNAWEENEADELLGLWAVKYDPNVLRKELVEMLPSDPSQAQEALAKLGLMPHR